MKSKDATIIIKVVDQDIQKIIKILCGKDRHDIAELLKYSTSSINESSTYGSRAFSRLSTFNIHSRLKEYEKLIALNRSDHELILKIVTLLYPPMDDSIEIRNIEFFPDVDLELEDQTVSCDTLKEIGFDYITEQIGKCENKVSSKDFEGAITNARTLIETVCLYILNENQLIYSYDGDLPKLFKKAYQQLKMDPSIYESASLKQILSGIISVVNGLSNLRNEMSDAHGKIMKTYYKPSERHAILAVNAAKTISEYIYKSWKNNGT